METAKGGEITNKEMIQAKDLRIGNWSVIKDANKNFDKEYKMQVEVNNLADIESLNYFAIGIQLTPRILEKAGAIKKTRQ